MLPFIQHCPSILHRLTIQNLRRDAKLFIYTIWGFLEDFLYLHTDTYIRDHDQLGTETLDQEVKDWVSGRITFCQNYPKHFNVELCTVAEAVMIWKHFDDGGTEVVVPLKLNPCIPWYCQRLKLLEERSQNSSCPLKYYSGD